MQDRKETQASKPCKAKKTVTSTIYIPILDLHKMSRDEITNQTRNAVLYRDI